MKPQKIKKSRIQVTGWMMKPSSTRVLGSNVKYEVLSNVNKMVPMYALARKQASKKRVETITALL